MVSSIAADALANPTEVLKDLYEEHDNPDTFAERVASHFSDAFATSVAPSEIPVLSIANPPENRKSGALVQLTVMIQDTSMSSEIYLAKLSDGGLGGWGLVEDLPRSNITYHDLRECAVVWAVTVPGESAVISNKDTPSSQAHKYPIPGAKHIGVKVKIYGSEADSFRTTDVVTFVGILASEPLHTDLGGSTSTLVPTLHVLFSRPATAPVALSEPIDQNLRSKLILWLADEALGGDTVAAEWIFLIGLAKVQSRTPPILPPILCLTRFPSAPTDGTPALSHALSLLFPYVTMIPLSLPTINTTPFAPESKNEDLHSGWLQLPKGSVCLVTETGVQEGTVAEAGLLNLHRMQEMMNSQMLEYVFPFSKFSFETDVNFIVICEGQKSAFFQNNVLMPLRGPTDVEKVYKTAKEVKSPPQLEQFQRYARHARDGTISISKEAAKCIQEDFVKERKKTKGITTDDFIHRMTLARLVALSYGETDITKETWEKTKLLDGARKQRLA